MKIVICALTIFLVSIFFSCTEDKLKAPTIPPEEERFDLGEARYVQLNPPLDAAHGYNFNEPSDIYVGADNIVYVADTKNNRIVMMDVGGAIMGYSQKILHPEAITQNDSLQLLVVNKTNAIFRIDLNKHNLIIGDTPIDTVYQQTTEPSRQFTGITVHNGFEYYVTVVDTADSSFNFVEFSFIYDFNSNNTLKGPLPLNVNGTGLYSAIVPTGIVSLRERYLDISPPQAKTPAFMFCQKGRTSLLTNNFKVQSVTTTIIEGGVTLIPNTSLIGSDLYDVDRYYFPEDITLDRNGFIFVLDKGRSITDPDTTKPLPGFYRFTSFGNSPLRNKQQGVLGIGSGSNQFNNPKGIAVLPFEEIQIVYVADTGNNRILMFKLSTQL